MEYALPRVNGGRGETVIRVCSLTNETPARDGNGCSPILHVDKVIADRRATTSGNKNISVDVLIGVLEG